METEAHRSWPRLIFAGLVAHARRGAEPHTPPWAPHLSTAKQLGCANSFPSGSAEPRRIYRCFRYRKGICLMECPERNILGGPIANTSGLPEAGRSPLRKTRIDIKEPWISSRLFGHSWRVLLSGTRHSQGAQVPSTRPRTQLTEKHGSRIRLGEPAARRPITYS